MAEDIVADAPLSIAVMKEELRMLADAHPMSPQGFERMQGLRRVVYDSADYVEGLAAFKEKRKAGVPGRMTKIIAAEVSRLSRGAREVVHTLQGLADCSGERDGRGRSRDEEEAAGGEIAEDAKVMMRPALGEGQRLHRMRSR